MELRTKTHPRTRGRVGAALLAAATGVLPGCASLLSASYSLPETGGAQPIRDRAGLFYLRMSPASGIQLERDGARLVVRTQPGRGAYTLRALGPVLPLIPIPGARTRNEPSRSVYLEVHYGSPSDAMRLDPNRVWLETPAGERLAPVGTSIPVRSGQREAYYTPDSRPLPGRWLSAEAGTRWCVVLEFYRPQPQDWSFRVGFDGVWMGEKQLEFDPIVFRRGRSWLLSWSGWEPACE